MMVHILLHAHTVTPLPLTNPADTIVGGAAVAVIAKVIGEHVVSSIGQMLVLNDKVDLDRFEVAPRLAEVPGKSPARHMGSA